MDGRNILERASWTLLNQCLVSGGNFMLNVLLARGLSEADYGCFTLFLGAIFFLRAIDFSLISYPLSVQLCVADADARRKILGNTAVLALALGLLLAAALALGIAMLGLNDILLPACLCYLCWQAQETSRRFLFADFRYRSATAGDGVAYAGQALVAAILLWTGSLTLPATLYAMAATFAAGAVIHASRQRFGSIDRRSLGAMAFDHFSIGKWSLLSYELVLIRVQLFPWMLAALSGSAATASLQASLNIANTMNPVILGIGNAIPQVASQAFASGGVRKAVRTAGHYTLIGMAPILVICGLGLAFPSQILEAVYGPSSPYLDGATCIRILVIAGVLDYTAEMIGKTLLGIRSGRLALLINGTAVAVAFGLGVPLVMAEGVLGACLALAAANLVRAVGAVIALLWRMAQQTRIDAVRVVRPAPAVDAAGRQLAGD